MLDHAFEISRLQVVRGERTLLSCGQLCIPANRVTAIIGPNGAGKTTLLRALAGHDGQCQGCLFGQPIARLLADGKRIAWVSQHEAADSPLAVEDYVMLGRHPHRGWFSRPSDLDREVVSLAMQTMELQDLAKRRLASLSGGERQRAAIARAMAQSTPVVILDEPTNHLDIRHQHILLRWLNRVALTGRTVITVLHDLGMAANYAHWLILLADGKVVAQGTPEHILHSEQLSQAFDWPIRAQRDGGQDHWRIDAMGEGQLQAG